MKKIRFMLPGLACAALLWCSGAPAQTPGPAGSAGEAARAIGGAAQEPESFQMMPITASVSNSDEQRLNADADQDNWRLYGRTYDNRRFSPLTQINAGNVSKLRPAAIIQTGVANSFENTAIEIDGVLYIETAFNQVQAYDAVTGQQFWSYIPKLEYSDLCCGPQARGVAVAYGKVFAAQLDGHVVALDAKTGTLIWKTDNADALPQPAHFYSFTMAPQVIFHTHYGPVWALRPIALAALFIAWIVARRGAATRWPWIVMLAAGTVPNKTVSCPAAPEKFCPLIVNDVPPLVDPEV